jgi:multisubunit Na+/H+ antiporter MnhE subunit
MPEHTRLAPLARRVLAWVLGWVFAATLYLLLIDTTSLPELIVGAVAAVLAATGMELAREQGIVGESIRWRWLLRLHRPLLKLPGDVALVSAAALAQLVRRPKRRGEFRAVRFRCGPEDQLASGRRALAEALGSFAPNTIIVGIDHERQLILAHQLHRSGGREAIDLLELG